MITQEKLKTLNDLLESHKTYFDITKFCFDKQIAFIEDKARFKVSVCSRRAGKTVACAADLIKMAISKPKQVGLYITLSRNNAKKIIWNELTEINRTFNLSATTNETELSLRFPNGSVIYLSGAKDKSEIEKFRGLAITLCYIDEAQSFKSYLSELVDDVISKALFDYNGTLCLIGTPGPVPNGYFYDCFQSPNWSKHGWTIFDNPWIQKKSGKTPHELLQMELDRKGVDDSDPSIQREVFGKWVLDYNSLVFRYEKDRNHYDNLPIYKYPWSYIVGVDIGFDDSDAIAVIGFNDASPHAYLVEEIIISKQGITELANQLEVIIKKYKPNAVMMDTGGLGKKIAEEINKRHNLPIRAAEKVRKFEFIELLNDAMRTGRFYAKSDSRFAQDSMLVEWDKDAMQLKISDRFHSDICDAVLYAYRESLHWLHEPEKPKTIPMTAQWFKEQEDILEEQAIKNIDKFKIEKEELLDNIALVSDEDWD